MAEPSSIKFNHVTKALNSSMEENCLQGSYWKKRSIYKLPACVTDLNRNAYKPQAVSFGPYHHGAAHLKTMEEHKWRALRHFLRRSGEKSTDDLVSAISDVVQDLKDCYDSLSPIWHQDTDSFIKLMILDGCFMLEILRTELRIEKNDYETDDPIFSMHGRLSIIPYIRRDMLMLENQLPMLVLDRLVAVGDGHRKEDHVNKLILNFFYHNETRVPDESRHVLDVYHKSLLYEKPSRMTQGARGAMVRHTEDAIIRSATELDEAGIGFKVSDSLSLRDISFTGGDLRLPMIVVDDMTESMFLNLIAFERFHVGSGTDASSYICFMDNLIDHERDVSLLHYKGIMQNRIGSDKAVAKLFNSLSRDVTPDKHGYLMFVYDQVNHHSNKRWNAWRANLMHTYFRSPWAILSLIAAFFLFGLTITQTIFTVFPRD